MEILVSFRKSAAFFGYVHMPPHQDFVAAVKSVCLHGDVILPDQLIRWNHQADMLMSDFANYSEFIVNNHHYNSHEYLPIANVFKPDWNFTTANLEAGGPGLEEKFAPEDA